MSALIFVFGILLPAAALIVELCTHLCGTAIIDPIPTPLHVLLVASVPLGNLYVFIKTRSKDYLPSNIDFYILAIVMGICGIYSVYFAPVAIFGLYVIFAYGLGLLPLAPLASLIASGLMMKKLFKLQKNSKNQFNVRSIFSAGGLCIAFCCLAGVICSSLTYKSW